GYTVVNNVVFVDAKTEIPNDPDRTYWLYVQVYDPVAKNNVVGVNYTSDPTPFTPKPLDPSNQLTAPTVLGGGPSGSDPLLAAAGSPLRSPNSAAGKPATASSEYDPGHTAALGNNDNAFDGWSPAGNDMNAWWQVDLGASYAIDAIEVVSRWSLD